MVNLKLSTDYDKFLTGMQSEIDRHKPSVPLVASNFADWQPQLKYDINGSHIEEIADQYVREYQELNNRRGNASDIFGKYYEKGERPSGFATEKIPQSEEYQALRENILSISDEIQAMGFQVTGISVASRSIHDPAHYNPSHQMILFDVWNDAIEKERDMMYHHHEPQFLREQAAETAAERAYEENWHRQNGIAIPDFDERTYIIANSQEQTATVPEFDKIVMLKDDDGKWDLALFPKEGNPIAVHPTKEDTSLFFTAVKSNNPDRADAVKQSLALKYYMQYEKDPSIAVPLFNQSPKEDRDMIEKANIFKNKEGKYFILAKLKNYADFLPPLQITEPQWQLLWLSPDRNEYKKDLAAKFFSEDVSNQKKFFSQAGPLAQEYNLTKTRGGWSIQPPGVDVPISLARIDVAKLEKDPSLFASIAKSYAASPSIAQHR